MARRDILLDDSGNRVLSGGDYAFAEDLQSVKQGIQVRVRLWLKEYWLDTSQGVPWREDILVRNANPAIVKADISAAIAATPDVTSVSNVSYSFDSQGRSAKVAYNAASPFGLVAAEVTT